MKKHNGMHGELSLDSPDVLPAHMGFHPVLGQSHPLMKELKNPRLSRRPEATSSGSHYRIKSPSVRMVQMFAFIHFIFDPTIV